MTRDDSERWMAESEAEYMADLMRKVGGSLNADVLAVMAGLYRSGWRDCWRAARCHGVEAMK